MKITSILFGLVFCSSIWAGVPKGCPYTRACTEDANCKLYALKHNCVGTCFEKKMQDLANNVVSCPAQCLCQKVEEIKA
jgi:hypothetical protein